jgi:transcription termination/antitermination protein NusA
MSKELLLVAETVAREKGIEPEEVVAALEEAIQKVGRSKYGMENDIRAHIDRRSGDITIARYRHVVEEIIDPAKEIGLAEAQTINPALTVDEYIVDVLPPLEFGRIAAQAAKQIISQKVRGAERSRQFAEYKDRVGEIISGIVKRAEFGNYIIDIGRAEAFLRREESIPRETLRPGDRIRCYILDVREELKGPQILLSRSHPNFMAQLFKQEVPEIYEGIIEVVSVARDPGSRAKIAVRSKDQSIDPIGACVGIRGSRVQAVVNELQGEKVDIVLWSENKATFIINALAPAEITKVVLNEGSKKVEVVVPEESLSLAIGRRGQNVRLGCILTGFDITILTEAQETDRRSNEFKTHSTLFMDALDVDEVIAQLLASEGFTAVEEVAGIDLADLASIEGFDEDIASELQARAAQYLETQDVELRKKCAEVGMQDDLTSFPDLTAPMLWKLSQSDIRTLDDLADLAGDELVDLVGRDMLTLEEANTIIMAARAHWFTE